MSSEPWAVRVHDLSKTYRINTIVNRPTLFSEAIVHRVRHPFLRATKENFNALTDVELDVTKAETVGIIGRNGAGKSTLLKILSRIVQPSTGRVELYGQIGSLLEVGTGFHPELTGRENVYLNGAILGMKRKQIDTAFDSIVDFAEISQFLDTPVKRYSSGMYVRLAFSVAAHLNPEILIVDEVLAVGDAAFQRKCLGKMGDVSSQEGRTVLFVSHNMAAVESFCQRGVYLDNGRVMFDGGTREAIDAYLGGGGIGDARGGGVFDLTRSERPGGTRDASILKRVELRRLDGTPGDTVRMGEGLQIIVDVDGIRVPQHGMAAVITSETDLPIINLGSRMKPLEVFEPKATGERVVLTIPAMQLLPGKYWIDLRVVEGGRIARKSVLDRVERAAGFEIVPADVFGSGFQFSSARELGVVFVDAGWQVQQNGTVIAQTAERVAFDPQGAAEPKKKAKKKTKKTKK